MSSKKRRKYRECHCMVKSTKCQLQDFRLDGFDSLMSSFCEKYGIEIPNMEDTYVNTKRRRQRYNFTYGHFYKVECFNTILDMQIQEFGARFTEESSELLICLGTLNPSECFHDFDELKLLRLVEFYPNDFSFEDKNDLAHQLRYYIHNVKDDERFANLNSISELARLMVETKKHNSYPLVYKLLKLALTLPVATASVERCFSAMKLMKSDFRNSNDDEFLNDSCICTIKKELLVNISGDDVITRFHKMKTRRGRL